MIFFITPPAAPRWFTLAPLLLGVEELVERGLLVLKTSRDAIIPRREEMLSIKPGDNDLECPFNALDLILSGLLASTEKLSLLEGVHHEDHHT